MAEIAGVGRGLLQQEVDKEQRGELTASSVLWPSTLIHFTFSNPLVSSEPQVCPIGIVGVFFLYKMVDLNILRGLGQLSSMPNAMIRDFWRSR